MIYTPDDALGYKFRDTVTGFEGTCTGACYYMGDNTELRLTDGIDNGKILEFWFNVARLERAD